jgi:hypothetical protein
MDHHPLSVPGLGHLEATAIAMNLAGKRKKYWRYNSRHAGHNYVHLALCLRGGLPVLMVGDVISKHVDWNFRLIILRKNLLRELADRQSCLIYGPDSPITVRYNPSATPMS